MRSVDGAGVFATMSQPSEADRYLLEQIRDGNPDGWSQLVERYQGRLLAFARGHVRNPADADDLVQDTFLSFLKALERFRANASLETYLFTLLRRRIVDLFRGRRVNVCSLQDRFGSERSGEDTTEVGSAIPSPDHSASWYARKNEDHGRIHDQLAERLRDLVDQMKRALDFRNLRIAELVFYAQLRNKEIARRTGVDEGQVALLKHRFIKRISPQKAASAEDDDTVDPRDASIHDAVFAHHAILTRVWEELRPSCPKRSTVGGYLLGTLEPDWHDYVDFHLNELGCRFCAANREDLERQSEDPDSNRLRDRIMQSSVGFLRKADG